MSHPLLHFDPLETQHGKTGKTSQLILHAPTYQPKTWSTIPLVVTPRNPFRVTPRQSERYGEVRLMLANPPNAYSAVEPPPSPTYH